MPDTTLPNTILIERPVPMGSRVLADAAPPIPLPLPLPADEIAAIAEHEHLTLTEAAARAVLLLDEPHGDAAIRQMVWDNLVHARQHGDDARAAALAELYATTCRRHPGRCDRRTAPTRETHPMPPDMVPRDTADE